MSSPPSSRDFDGLIAETWGQSTLTRPDVMALLEPYRERVDHLMDDFEDDQQSWRDYCGCIFGWRHGDDPSAQGAIPNAVQAAVEALLKQPAPSTLARQPMVFAFDFDGTWTRDPEGMRAAVKLLQGRGHTCVLLTGRGDEHTWGNEVRAAVGDLMPIVFAANAWKRDAAKAAGYAVDIFVDDHPEYIAAQDPRLTVGRPKFGGASQKKPPKLAAENIRFGSSWLYGATIRDIRGGYLLIGTMRPGEAAALTEPFNSGALVPIPLLGDGGETVVVTLFVRGFRMAQSAKVREVWDVELDLIGTSALRFDATEVP